MKVDPFEAAAERAEESEKALGEERNKRIDELVLRIGELIKSLLEVTVDLIDAHQQSCDIIASANADGMHMNYILGSAEQLGKANMLGDIAAILADSYGVRLKLADRVASEIKHREKG